MKRVVGAALVGILAGLAGCTQQPVQDSAPVQRLTSVPPGPAQVTAVSPAVQPPSVSSAQDQIVARINGQAIDMQELMKPLLESHGLQILMGLAQVDLLKQEARDAHEVVTPEDVRHEQEMTLRKMFKDADQKEQDQLDEADAKHDTETAGKLRDQIRSDREALLAQYLDNQHFSRTEFDLKIEINAYLRKAAERLLAGKITDEMVEKQFGVEYGETVEVRYIQLANMQEVAQARQRLKDGEDFAAVAASMSRNERTAAMGGLMQPFSRQTGGLPESFKDLAFSLQPGQVSDTLNFGGNFFILRLEHKYPPKAVKFDNVKESLRKSMFDRLAQSLIEQLDQKLKALAAAKLQIENPILKEQFAKIQQQDAAVRDRQKIDQQWQSERGAALATQPATTLPPAPAPAATEPAAAPATQP